MKNTLPVIFMSSVLYKKTRSIHLYSVSFNVAVSNTVYDCLKWFLYKGSLDRTDVPFPERVYEVMFKHLRSLEI